MRAPSSAAADDRLESVGGIDEFGAVGWGRAPSQMVLGIQSDVNALRNPPTRGPG
jgi:hypothetical protein